MDYPTGFYVYRLKDPRSGLPFYVGKGQKRRAWQHEAAVRAGKSVSNQRKTEKIASILQAGLAVEIEIVEVFDSAADALDLEWRLVDADPTLTNIQEGGIGSDMSPEQCAKLARRRRQRLLELRRLSAIRRRKAEEIERAEKMVKRINRERALACTEKDRSEIAQWHERLAARQFDANLICRKPRRRGGKGRSASSKAAKAALAAQREVSP